MANPWQNAINANTGHTFGATIMGGNTGGIVTKSLGIETIGYHSGTHGSVVPGPATRGDSAPTIGAQEIRSSGNWGKTVAGSYVMRLVTTTLAGLANTALQSPASNSNEYRPIRLRESQRSITYGIWNLLTNQPATAVSHQFGFYSLSAGDLATSSVDNAAYPTRTIPGELTYLATGTTPTNADYKALT